MLMDLTAIGCVLVAGAVMTALWLLNARGSDRNSRNNADGLKNGKGGKTE